MNQDIIYQLGSMLGGAIAIAMALVPVVAGAAMVFDAIRLYRTRTTVVRKSPSGADLEPVAEPASNAPELPGAREAAFAYRETR